MEQQLSSVHNINKNAIKLEPMQNHTLSPGPYKSRKFGTKTNSTSQIEGTMHENEIESTDPRARQGQMPRRQGNTISDRNAA